MRCGVPMRLLRLERLLAPQWRPLLQLPYSPSLAVTLWPNYALKRTVRDEVSGENHALRSARPLSLGVRLVRACASRLVARVQCIASSSVDRASASLAVSFSPSHH